IYRPHGCCGRGFTAQSLRAANSNADNRIFERKVVCERCIYAVSVPSRFERGSYVVGENAADDAATISTKRLSLLKQMLPNMRRVAMLWNRDDLGMSLRYGASAKAAEVLGVGVQALGVREPDDFDGVFEAMEREPPDAILMVSDVLTVLNRKRVFDF